MLLQKYKKNPQVKYRKMDTTFLLYNFQTRKLFNMNVELFKFWEHIENVQDYLADKNISQSSAQNIIQVFLHHDLIIGQ